MLFYKTRVSAWRMNPVGVNLNLNPAQVKCTTAGSSRASFQTPSDQGNEAGGRASEEDQNWDKQTKRSLKDAISILELVPPSLSRAPAGLPLSPPLTHAVPCSAHSIIYQLTDALRRAKRREDAAADLLSAVHCCSFLSLSSSSKVTIPPSTPFHVHRE